MLATAIKNSMGSPHAANALGLSSKLVRIPTEPRSESPLPKAKPGDSSRPMCRGKHAVRRAQAPLAQSLVSGAAMDSCAVARVAQPLAMVPACTFAAMATR